MTKVINLFAGPGVGKSTLASEIYTRLKIEGKSVEYVREFVKGWAWQGKIPGMFDQAYIFGKQSQEESKLYGKVDYIVTDSPFLLSPFYESFNYSLSITKEAALKFYKLAEEQGVQFHNFYLVREGVTYNSDGRFQPESVARSIDVALKNFLVDLNINIEEVSLPLNQRANYILTLSGL